MRTGSVLVAILFFLTTVCAPQTASSEFEKEYELAVKQNPPGLLATLEIVGDRTVFRMSDRMELKLLLKAQKAGIYSFFSGTGHFDEELVVQPPDPLHSMKIGLLAGCIDSCTLPITSTAVVIRQDLILGRAARGSFIADLFQRGGVGTAPLPPGEYAIYIQTKCVWESISHGTGEPNRKRQMLVTSDNVLHVTLLPDVNAVPGSAAPRQP